MAITDNDVRLLKSQRLTDEADGGGRATGVAVVDGEVNNLFPDISRLDRTLGRVGLRKAFAGVLTDNADPYLGTHAILTEVPKDPRVSVLLFPGTQTDERAEAQNRIESYVAPATAAQWELLGNQLTGQRAITAVQREESRLPEVGEVYQLQHGQSSQYVRLTSVEAALENFIYELNGNVQTLPRRRLTLGIAAPLLTTYPGGSVTPGGTSALNLAGQAKSLVLATQVADAARYYGMSRLAEAVAAGSLSLKVASVYAPLVPSNTRETPLVDQLGGATRRQMLASGPARSVVLQFAQVSAGHSRSYLGTGALPGSLSLTLGGVTYSDDRRGHLNAPGNAFTSLTVDYASGEINAYRASTYTGSATAGYTPAAAVSGETLSGLIRIGLANRGYTYTLNLAEAKPRPGTLVVSYMALGKWYELRDSGAGELEGEGSGTVQFASGSVSLTLAVLPDAGSALLYSYIAAVDTQVVGHSGTARAEVRVRHQLPHSGLQPGSVTVEYRAGGSLHTLTDATGDGRLSGAGSGSVVYADGVLDLRLNQTPDAGSAIVYRYRQGLALDHAASHTLAGDANGMVSGTMPGAPFAPGSVVVRWTTRRRNPVPRPGARGVWNEVLIVEHAVRDDGAGGWVYAGDDPLPEFLGADGLPAAVPGFFEYATGEYALRVATTYPYTQYSYFADTRQFDAIAVGA